MQDNSLLTVESIEEWNKERDPDNRGDLKELARRGQFSPEQRAFINKYFKDRKLLEDARSVAAAEALRLSEEADKAEVKRLRILEVDAAVQSAAHAKDALRFSKWAIWVSIAALFVAALPMILKQSP